jgi:thioredoxin-like negative regulator of GroEL
MTSHARDLRDSEPAAAQPQLLFFYSGSSGPSRRAEGFLAQVLQRRRNHDTFRIRRIDVEQRLDLAQRCGIDAAPAFIVLEENKVRARLQQPRGCADIRETLAPWLR